MRSIFGACFLAALFVSPAFADDPAKKGSDADDVFMTGVRKLGVMVGEAFMCTPQDGREGVGDDALQLANQIAIHFGLQAAFIFSGSFGYGTGHDFDKSTCPATLDNFKDVQHKYLNK